MTLSQNFYTLVCPTQTVTTRELKQIMLETGGEIFACGRRKILGHKRLGAGVYKVYVKSGDVCPYCGRGKRQ